MSSDESVLVSDDQILQEAFAAYLKLPVFPIPLEYQSIDDCLCLVEPSRSHLTDIWRDKGIQDSLNEWVSSRRTPYFIKSYTYTEYCFCKQLIKSGKCRDINYCQFKCFQSKLAGTKGGIHLELWLKLKHLFSPSFPQSPSPSPSPCSSSLLSPSLINDSFHTTNDYSEEQFDFNELSIIRKQYGPFLTELKMPLFPVYSEQSAQVRWCQHVLSQLTHRLTDYWWLRYSSELCLGDCVHESMTTPAATSNSGDLNISTPLLTNNDDDFLTILSSEHIVGRPYLDFLCRGSLDEEVSQYHLLEDITAIFKHNTNNDLQFRRAVVSCANRYIDANFKTVNIRKMLEYFTDPNHSVEALKELLYGIQDILIFNLRRKWTSFLHEDYESFCSCFPSDVHFQLLPISMCPFSNVQVIDTQQQTDVTFESCQHQSPTVLKDDPRHKKDKLSARKVDATLSTSDLIGTQLASLSNNPQALEDFKTFLIEHHGTESIEYASLDVWLMILVHKKIPKNYKSAHARKIFRNFLSPNAKVPAFIWKSDKAIPRRPGTPLLQDIQMQAFENFSNILIEFLKLLHSDSTTHSNSRPSTDMRFFESNFDDEDISFKDLNHVGRKLHQFLLTNVNEKSQKMGAFERFLIKRGPPDCPHLLLNSLYYWMEVHTFQSLQKGSPDVNFLAKKIVALVNRFLDTATPPWVKIAISNEMAQNLTDMAASLLPEASLEGIETTSELLTKSKMVVLSHLVQFWIEFNRLISDDSSSQLSIHLTTESSPSKSTLISSNKGSIRTIPPPTPPIEGRKSSAVLTFSRQDGLQWK